MLMPITRGALPDEAALAGHHAALPVDDPLSGDLSQHRRGLLPHLRGPHGLRPFAICDR